MPNPAIYNETGFEGQVISQGGIKGASYKGRQVISGSFTFGGSNPVYPLIMAANPRRISAIIQNLDDPAAPGSVVAIYLGGVNTIPITLAPLGTLQLDVNFPWTGEVYANVSANSPVVTVLEITTT